jgi:hypothetical protein
VVLSIALNIRARAVKLKLGACVHSAGKAERLVAGCQGLTERNITQKLNGGVNNGQGDGMLKFEEKEKLGFFDEIRVLWTFTDRKYTKYI